MKYVAVWLIRLYQKFISPLKRNPCCRFTPTCSAYAVEAFLEWGFICGFGLTVWRILRCNPFCRGGYDPVPKRKHRRKAADPEDTGGADPSDNEENTTDEDPHTQIHERNSGNSRKT